MNRATGTHIDIKPLFKRSEKVIAVVTIDSQVAKQRRLRLYAFNRTAGEVCNESHDVFFDGDSDHGE